MSLTIAFHRRDFFIVIFEYICDLSGVGLRVGLGVGLGVGFGVGLGLGLVAGSVVGLVVGLVDVIPRDVCGKDDTRAKLSSRVHPSSFSATLLPR